MVQSSAVFCEHGPKSLTLRKNGPLQGFRLAVKDLFYLVGEKNAAGNPVWFETHDAATDTADALNSLLEAGAEFVGFTQTDELAYSLAGNNIHYGVADNPAAPGHHCGGSSMGSAAAVAAELAEVALGTDTGGSVRVPASYCGLFGFRPSHGAVSVDGLIPLAPAFDTVGWFSKSVEHMSTVGELLLPSGGEVSEPDTLIVCEDFLMLADPELRTESELEINKLSAAFSSVKTIQLKTDSVFNELSEIFRVLQGREIARTHGDWIKLNKPTFGSDVDSRFTMAMALSEEEERVALEKQKNWCAELSDILRDNSVLFLPTTPTTAPKIGSSQTELRTRLLCLTAIAGLSGSCQIHIPSCRLSIDGNVKPYGFSYLMAPGQDKSLIATAVRSSNLFSI